MLTRTVPGASYDPPVATVGVIANPASGRDIRRLVTGASVFDNAEKGSMVFRLMAGLGAAGVERVLMMPAADGVGSTLDRQLRNRHATLPDAAFPALHVLDQAARGTAEDTVDAVAEMCAQDVAAIVVLGGDGTHRVVARGAARRRSARSRPAPTTSFPEMREATVAGLAVGLFATGAVPATTGVSARRRCACGSADRQRGRAGRRRGEPRALRRLARRLAGGRRLRAVRRALEPGAVGLSSIAGLLAPGPLHVRGCTPAPQEAAHRAARAARARADHPRGRGRVSGVEPGAPVEVRRRDGTLALDGEREIERTDGDPVTVELTAGPAARRRRRGHAPRPRRARNPRATVAGVGSLRPRQGGESMSTAVPPGAGELTKEELLEGYRVMRTIREFEERLHREFATGEIPGFVHLYAGEEAIAAGVCATCAPTTTSPPPTAATATRSPRAATSRA